MPTRRPMTPEDIRRIVVVEELDISADGRTAIVVRRSIRGNRYLGHLAGSISPLVVRSRTSPVDRGQSPRHETRLGPDGHTLAFIRTDPADDDSVAAIGLLDIRRPDRVSMRRSAGTVRWATSPGRPMAVDSHSPPRSTRRGSSRAGPARSPGVVRRRARTPSRRSPAISPRPTGAGTRRATAIDGRTSSSTHPLAGRARCERRLGCRRDRVASRRPHHRLLDRPGSGTRHPTADDDLGGRCGRREGRTLEVLAPGGWATHPTWSPDGRWIAAQGLVDAEALDDVAPSVMVGPADGSRPPRLVAPDLDRPVGSEVDPT